MGGGQLALVALMRPACKQTQHSALSTQKAPSQCRSRRCGNYVWRLRLRCLLKMEQGSACMLCKRRGCSAGLLHAACADAYLRM